VRGGEFLLRDEQAAQFAQPHEIFCIEMGEERQAGERGLPERIVDRMMRSARSRRRGSGNWPVR
jgi:hypothetical protein